MMGQEQRWNKNIEISAIFKVNTVNETRKEKMENGGRRKR